MKLFTFTRPDGGKVALNLANVEVLRRTDESFGTAKGGHTEIILSSGAIQVVTETLEEVMNLCTTAT
jgi:hypothetical protein